jgi:hypothetical protein
VKLTNHFQLVPRSGKRIYIYSPISPHGVVLNELNTGTTLQFNRQKVGINLKNAVFWDVTPLPTIRRNLAPPSSG